MIEINKKLAKIFKFIIFAFISNLLASCANFNIDQSIYKEISCISVEVENKDSIPIYEFKKHFEYITDFAGCKKPQYLLKIKFNEYSNNHILLKESEIVRQNIELMSEYSLYNLQNDDKLTSDRIRLINSYSTMFSPYSSEQEAEESALELYISTAEELRRKMILFFKNLIPISN